MLRVERDVPLATMLEGCCLSLLMMFSSAFFARWGPARAVRVGNYGYDSVLDEDR